MYETLVAALRNVNEYDSGYAKLMYDAADAIEALSKTEKTTEELQADVRPVVRGKWLNDFCGKGRFSKRIVQCSLCGNFLDLDGVNAGRGDANYCPNCGADMREPPKEE